MTRSSTEIWNEIKNSPLNTGVTTGEVRLNYWDGRDVLLLGGKYLLDTEKAYANSGSVGYGQLHDTGTVLDTSGYVTTNTGRTFITWDAGFHMSTLAICGGIIAFTDDGLFQAWRSNLSDEYKHLVDEAERTIGEYLGEEMTILTFPDTRPYARGGNQDNRDEQPTGILARIRTWWTRA